jgi:hypothetical protein
MLTIKLEDQVEKPVTVPRLKELLTPCPICGGTTDMDLGNHIVCQSCKQAWTITGKPILNSREYVS